MLILSALNPREGRSVAQLLEAAVAQDGIDVALVVSADLDGNPASGFQAVRELTVSRPMVRAVMLLDGSKHEQVVQAFGAGARRVLSRNQSLLVLCSCIRCVHGGQIWVNSQQLDLVLEEDAR